MTFNLSLHGWRIVYRQDDLLFQVISPIGVIVQYFPTSRQAITFVEWASQV